jgi:hypothetical protein
MAAILGGCSGYDDRIDTPFSQDDIEVLAAVKTRV